MEASDKQIKILASNGYEINDVMVMDKKAISDAIKAIYEKKGWNTENKKEEFHPLNSREEEEIGKVQKSNAYAKDPVGLAVEIFCSIRESFVEGESLENIMNDSIALVKQAQNEFE